MGVYRYYHNNLPKDELQIYDEIYDGLVSMKDKIEITPDATIERAIFVWKRVLEDSPSFFYVAPKFQVSQSQGKLLAIPEYSMSNREVSNRWNTIDRKLAEYMTAASGCKDEYSKVLGAYEYIIRSCQYGFSKDDQNMCSVFCDGISCCAGYSAAFKFLCDNARIPSVYVSGYVDGRRKTGSHAWNLVCIDGKWSGVDVTWGDPIKDKKDWEEVSYEYFGLPDRYLSQTHTPDAEVMHMLPTCNDESHDWFVKNNMFFKTYDIASVTEAIQGDILKREIGQEKDEKGECHLKFANPNDRMRAYDELCQKGKFNDIIKPVYDAYGYDTSKMRFSQNEDVNTVVIRYEYRKRS